MCKMPGSKKRVKGVQESASNHARPPPTCQATGERSEEGRARREARSSRHMAPEVGRQGRGGRSVAGIKECYLWTCLQRLIFYTPPPFHLFLLPSSLAARSFQMTEGTGTQDPKADSAAVLKHGGSTGFSESPRPETDPSPPFSQFQPWEPSRGNSIRTKIEGIIRSFSEHLLSTYCVPERVLRTENSAVKKTERKTETINRKPQLAGVRGEPGMGGPLSCHLAPPCGGLSPCREPTP